MLPFCHLPPDVLDHVAFHLATAEPLGPPSCLVPLLSTHSHLYNLLSISRNAHLYARIFRAMFDYHAPQRRFPDDASYSLALAAQLVRNCESLQRIRRGDLLVDDLYRAFALCLENDGRNAAQLQWAGLPDLIERYVSNRLWHGRDRSHNWPRESRENAFALWLYWYTLTPDRLAAHTPAQRNLLQTLIRPYAVYNFRYPPFLAPDIHWSFPLHAPPDVLRDHSVLTPHGFYPQYREPRYLKLSFLHYADDLTLAEPPIGLVAKLLYVALLEHQPQEYPSADLLPADRAEADDIGARGPTLADYLAFSQLRAARPPTHGPSTRHDSDWDRWRACYNPWSDKKPARTPYTPGSLSGLWGGRFLDPDVDDYFHAIAAGTYIEQPTLTSASAPLYMRLREHHCLSPAVPLPAEEDVMNAFFPRDFPDDRLWSVSESEREGRLSVGRRGGRGEWAYETYVEGKGRRGGHDEETCGLCAERRDEEERMQQRAPALDVEMDVERCRCEGDSGCECECGDCDSASDPEDAYVRRARQSVQDALGRGTDLEQFIERVAREAEPELASIDPDTDTDSDSDADTDADADDASLYSYSAALSDSDGSTASDMEAMLDAGEPKAGLACDGVVDIIITGETPRTAALAWRPFHIYGRVRPWDGLVVLVRAPADPRERDTYVFRGYLVGGAALVGAWRHVTDSVHSVPLEGVFVVGRVGEDALGEAEADDPSGPGAGTSLGT